MTTISAKIIKDSICLNCPRITTMLLRYPRAIHSELMTHRVFSRNASSSRAIPVERLIQDVIDDPFVPLHWGKNQPGMQAYDQCNEPLEFTLEFNNENTYETFKVDREKAWLRCMSDVIEVARAYAKAGYHKQIVNRLLEPWAHINVLVTSTEWQNFLKLRNHPAAEPHIQLLAKEIEKALENSKPNMLETPLVDWHLPFVEDNEIAEYMFLNQDNSFIDKDLFKKVSAARCARTSYLNFDGVKPSIESDLKLYSKLVESVPMHASPLEHQACPDVFFEENCQNKQFHGNFKGWIQFRKVIENRNKNT